MKKIKLFLLVVMQLIICSKFCEVRAQDNLYTFKVDDISYSGYSFTELGYYCFKGDVEKVKELVEGGADIKYGMCDDYFRYGVLHTAIFSENLEMVEYVLSKEPNVNSISSESGYTPINSAIEINNSEKSYQITKLLLDKGAKPDGGGYLGFPTPTTYPLLEAIRMGHVEIVKLLIDKGCSLGFRNSYNLNALNIIAALGDNEKAIEIFQILLNAGYKDSLSELENAINMAQNKNHTALAKMFIDYCDKLLVGFVLKNDENADFPYYSRNGGLLLTELGFYVDSRNYEKVIELIENNANYLKCGTNGNVILSGLDIAQQNGDKKMINILKEVNSLAKE